MTTAAQIVSFATSQLGKPYVDAAAGPDAFDCSGFIHYVLKSCGIPNTRTSVAGYWASDIYEKISSPMVGHLVFFQNTYKPGPSHMGIMVSDTEFIHASDSTTGVIKSKVNNVYWEKYFLGYGKIKGVSGSSSRFIDVPQGHWAYDAIEYMAANNLMNGYGNGYFGVGDGITREQMASVLYRVLKPTGTIRNPFFDIDNSPFQKEILALTERGVFARSDYFYPNRIATRAEVATVIMKAFDLKVKADYEFIDMAGHWANTAVKALYSNGITSGSGDKKFNPDIAAGREQFALFLYRAIFVDPNFYPQPI